MQSVINSWRSTFPIITTTFVVIKNQTFKLRLGGEEYAGIFVIIIRVA